jgi:hypothetical protein
MDEIMAILGHATEGEARGYVTQANKRVMAASAREKSDRMSNKSYKILTNPLSAAASLRRASSPKGSRDGQFFYYKGF